MRVASTAAVVVVLSMVGVGCSEEASSGDTDTVDTSGDTSGDVPDGLDDTEDTQTLLPLDLADPIPAGRVLAGVAAKPADLVQGPKAEGQLGDLVMKNARATFVIEGARRAGGYRMWGGQVVDVVVDGAPDRFGELWFAWNLLAFRPERAEVVDAGDGGAAHVRVTGRTDAYPWPDSFIRPILMPGDADVAVTYDFTLAPDATRLEWRVTLTNVKADGTPGSAVSMDYPFVAMNMGDGVKSFAPERGIGGVQGASGLPWAGALGPEATYALDVGSATLNGLFSYANVDLMTLPAFELAPGATQVFDLAVIAATDGSSGIEAQRAGSPATATVSGTVTAADLGPKDVAWVALTRQGGDGELGALDLVRDGRFTARVPPGLWTATAYATGRAASASMQVDTSDDGPIALNVPEPATVVVTIRDTATTQPIPAQLTVIREADTPTPFAPASVRLGPDWGSGRSTVVYAVTPGTRAQIPAGRYRAIASRGFSYELSEVALVLEAGEEKVVDLSIDRSVDTSGWSAGDFHLHGLWSSDSDVPYDARVRQAAANDLALPIMTEHAYIGDLLTAAELAGVSDFVAPIPAQEVTTFEYGHFNAFPLTYDPDAVSGGAVFEHGREGATLFDAIHAQQPERVMIQVNHPRSSVPFFAYFDYVDLDSASGVARNPARWTTNWDLVEVFNSGCESEGNTKARTDWYRMNNLGWKKTLSSGSDSHSEGAGAGTPRNWVAIETGAVALDPQAIVAPLEARKAFVSCGPFVRMTSSDGKGLGEMASVDQDGEVAFAVKVEAPTWIGVTTVRLVENGVIIATETMADAHAGPDLAHPAVRFDGVLKAKPVKDSWYVVEVLGVGDLAPVWLEGPPYALTNPIDVDADGDGTWTPPGNAAAP